MSDVDDTRCFSCGVKIGRHRTTGGAVCCQCDIGGIYIGPSPASGLAFSTGSHISFATPEWEARRAAYQERKRKGEVP